MVIQNNVFNQSRIHTVVVCALTSNLQRASAPGNMLLEAEEGNLPKQSVVVVSQIFTIDKSQLGEYWIVVEETDRSNPGGDKVINGAA